MKYALAAAAAVAALLGPACTDSADPYFEGTITSMFVIKDVYTIPNSSVDIRVAKLPVDPTAPPSPCDQANVRISDSTFIYRADRPLVRLGREALAVTMGIRVSPLPASDVCPLPINAKVIAIITDQLNAIAQ